MSAPAFHLIEVPGAQPLARWWPEIAGLSTGLAWSLGAQPWPPAPLSALQLWALATRCTLPVFAAAALATWVACRASAAAEKRDSVRTITGIACAATWFPPLVLFLRHGSPWAAAIAMALSIAGTRAMLHRLQPSEQAAMLPAAGAAAGLHIAALGILGGSWRAAAAGLPLAAALITWIMTERLLWPRKPSSGRRTLRVVPALVLALGFSGGGLTPYLSPGGSSNGAAGLLRALFGGTSDGAGSQPDRAAEVRYASFSPDRVPRGVAIGDVYPAVMLLPEVEPYTTLIAPQPVLRVRALNSPLAQGPGIPFSGFYSFRRATLRPPRFTHTVRGDAAELRFRTTDASPLVMEAHQDFGRPIYLACCRQIGIESRVADPKPGTVRMELLLADSAAPQGEKSLGTEDAGEMVRFAVPQTLPLVRFDRLTVRFHLFRPRGDQSARVAIRRFLFIP